MDKKYSFEKDKVVDAEYVETDSELKETAKKNGFSFKDKLKQQGSAFAKGSKILAQKTAEAYKEYNKPENVLKRKKFQAEKTGLDAKIAKNKAQINKYTQQSQGSGGMGFDLGLGGSSSNDKKKKKGGGGLFDGDFF